MAVTQRASSIYEQRVYPRPRSETPTVSETPTRTLLIGVLSFDGPGRLQRRRMIHRLSSPSLAASLLFVLPAGHKEASNVTGGSSAPVRELRVRMPVGIDARYAGKLILQNCFFRHAVSLSPPFQFVGRACAAPQTDQW